MARVRPSRRWLSPQLLALAGILVSVAFGYIAVGHVHWSATWAALKSTDYLWLVPALAVPGVNAQAVGFGPPGSG
jgi:uncharacterized membrane protein YbhN (UPF0104 family)